MNVCVALCFPVFVCVIAFSFVCDVRRVWLDIHVVGLRDLTKPGGQVLNIR